MIFKLGMVHQGLKVYKSYIYDDPGLTKMGERLQDYWSSGLVNSVCSFLYLKFILNLG